MPRVVLAHPPQNREALWWTVRALFGVTIPRTRVCPDHCSPFDAFADAYFRECSIRDGQPITPEPMSQAIWHASRGLAGKSKTLSVLGLTFGYIEGADITVLGGSMAQSTNVHDYMVTGMEFENLPQDMTMDQTATKILLSNRGRIRPLPASQKHARGPHPSALLMDEVDEMEIDIYDAALGQPLPHENYLGRDVDTITVISSTWQNAEGTLTEIFQRNEERGNRIPIYRWCYLENHVANNPPGEGWLTEKTIQEKRDSVSAEMFRTEYDLGEPSIGNRAIDPERIEAAFCRKFKPDDLPGEGEGYIDHTEQKDFWVYEFEPYEKGAVYVAGADWAKEKDYTVIFVARVWTAPDGKPMRRLVYFRRVNRRPYPVMIGFFNKALRTYKIPSNGAWHDSTGLGDVVDDYVDIRARAFPMTGDKRARMLSNYVNAIEKGSWELPRIPKLYTEHKFCVGIGSLVRTLDGCKRIEQVEVGDRVLTRVGWRRVEATWDNGVRPVVRLRTSDGKEVLLTPDHSVATGRGWVQAQSLEYGDVLHVILADPAGAAAGSGDDERSPFIGMPERAVSNARPECGDPYPSVDVLALGDSFQVVGVAAGGAPAQVIDHGARRDRSLPECVRQPVGQMESAGAQASIAERVTMPRPDPTLSVPCRAAEDEGAVESYASRPPTAVRAANRRPFPSVDPTIETAAHVVSVTRAGAVHVFDLTVEGAHEFTANGIVVHNCSVGDLYNSAAKFHLPDTVCAGALAENAARRVTPAAAPIVVRRSSAPTRAEAQFTRAEERHLELESPAPADRPFSMVVR